MLVIVGKIIRKKEGKEERVEDTYFMFRRPEVITFGKGHRIFL